MGTSPAAFYALLTLHFFRRGVLFSYHYLDIRGGDSHCITVELALKTWQDQADGLVPLTPDE